MNKKLSAVISGIVLIIFLIVSSPTPQPEQSAWWFRRRTPTATRVITKTTAPSMTPTTTKTPTPTSTNTPIPLGTPVLGKTMQCFMTVRVDGVDRPPFEVKCPSSVYYYNP